MVEEAERAWQSLGSVEYKTSIVEEKSKQFRRSIYFVKEMKAGDIITKESVRCVRPGYGLEPKYWDRLMNQKVKKNVAPGDPVSFDVLI